MYLVNLSIGKSQMPIDAWQIKEIALAWLKNCIMTVPYVYRVILFDWVKPRRHQKMQRKKFRTFPFSYYTVCDISWLSGMPFKIGFICDANTTVTMQTIATGTLNINSIAVESAQSRRWRKKGAFFGSPNIVLMEFFSAPKQQSATVFNGAHYLLIFKHSRRRSLVLIIAIFTLIEFAVAHIIFVPARFSSLITAHRLHSSSFSELNTYRYEVCVHAIREYRTPFTVRPYQCRLDIKF